jgi:hypothetical protein
MERRGNPAEGAMSVKHLEDHVVQTDEDYVIKNDDRIVLVVAPSSGATSPIRLRLPNCAHRGHKLTIVASDIDVIVSEPEGG